MSRVAILISGGGSNMVELVRSMGPDHPGKAQLVVSNRPEAGGLARARALNVPTFVVDHRAYADRPAFEEELGRVLEAARIDTVCLAGFMRILTPDFVNRWAGRMLNIHPSLLPKYPGLNTHARALAAGDAEHGATVHEVTGELDMGPICGRARLSIRPGETEASLAARVLDLEHRLYPAVLRRFLGGNRAPVDLDFTTR